uniref:PQRFa peptide n=1 Tax=Branchiostoma japonicum TaxID=373177 RepID=A0A024FMK9_9BRAN|nr:PQRFa peptide precursor [Branchiostoma japonicum]
MRTLVVLTWISTLFPFLLAATATGSDPRTTYKVSRWDEAWRPQRFGRSGRGDHTKDGWRPQRFGRGRDQGWRPQRFGRTEAGLREVLGGEAFPLLQMTRTDLHDDLPAMAVRYTPPAARLRALPLLRLYDRGALSQLINGPPKQPATNREVYPPSLRMIRAAAEGLRGFAHQQDKDTGESFAPPRSNDDWLAEIQRLGLRGRKRRDVS